MAKGHAQPAWTEDDEAELQAINKQIDDIKSGKTMEGASATSIIGNALLDLGRGDVQAQAARNEPGQDMSPVERVKQGLPSYAAIPAAHFGGKGGRAIGEKVGSLFPEPLTTPARVVLGKAGEWGGRVLAAGATGSAVDTLTHLSNDEEMDDWGNNLHIGRGVVEGLGEAASIPITGTTSLIKRVGQGLAEGKIDPNARAVASWMHDNFKRSYNLAADDVRKQIIKDPKYAEKMIANQGLTRAEKLNNRLFDLFHGVASAGYWGGGMMRRSEESRDDLFRLTAKQFGDDVGKHMDGRDLADAVADSVQHKFSIESVGKIPLVNALEAKSKGAMINTKSMDWTAGSPRAFGFMHAFEDSPEITVKQYRQLRDQAQKIASDFKADPELRAQATKYVAQLDRRARRSLPPDGLSALKDLQSWERDFKDTWNNSFVEGILSDKTRARKWVEGMMKRPDYKQLQQVISVIEDPDVKDSMRRALLDRTLSNAMLPSGKMTGDSMRKTVSETVGEKPLKEILGKGMSQNVEKFVQAREFLQGRARRGETGRVATALTQGSQFARLAYNIGPALMGGGLAYGAGAGAGPALMTSVALLATPRVAAGFLSGPGANRYVKFMQALNSPNYPKNKLMYMGKQVLGQVMDKNVAERLVGKWWAREELSNEHVDALNKAYHEAGGDREEAPSSPDQPGPNYPEGMELGR